MNIASLVFSVGRSFPAQPAITDARGTTSYAQFIDRVARVARSMASIGAVPGDRVVIFMENRSEFLEVLLAAFAAGLIAVPVNAKLHHREVQYIIENCEARLLFTSPGLTPMDTFTDAVDGLRAFCAGTAAYELLTKADKLEPVDRAQTDPAWVFYTSGTTGRPKGAVLTHRGLIFMSQTYYADVDMVDERDTKLHAAPLSHGTGLYGLPFLLKGAHHVIHPGFDVEAIIDALGRYERVSLFMAPTMLTRLFNHPGIESAKLQNLQTIYYGGGPTYLADLERAVAILGPCLFQLYAQGETPMTATGLTKAMHADPAMLATCGIARSGVQVRVVDPDDRDLSPGEIGEIVTRSDTVMQGYWNNPAATAEVLRGGWLHTGDLGSLNDRGCLTLHDRSKDVIISGGTNIYPREIEEVLLRHPAVLEVAVVGRPHPDWGEYVVAFVVCQPGRSASDAELEALCLENIARFKRPKHYRRLEKLPTNHYGKVLKTELRNVISKEEDI